MKSFTNNIHRKQASYLFSHKEKSIQINEPVKTKNPFNFYVTTTQYSDK